MVDTNRGVHVARSSNGAMLNPESRFYLGFTLDVVLTMVLLLFIFATTAWLITSACRFSSEIGQTGRAACDDDGATCEALEKPGQGFVVRLEVTDV